MNSNNDLQELIKIKKLKQQLQDSAEIIEEFSQEEEEIIPKTFKEKWDNYWYHYTLITFIVAFVLIMAFWFAKDMLFKPKYDLAVNIASKYSFSAVTKDLSSVVVDYIEDYDENGKVNVLVNEMQTNYDGTATNNEAAMAGETRILAILNAGIDAVFILDDTTYNALLVGNGEESIFLDFSEYYPEGTQFVNGDKIMLKETELGKKLRMNAVKSEMYLCVRKFDGSFTDTEKNRDKLKDALSFINNVINYK